MQLSGESYLHTSGTFILTFIQNKLFEGKFKWPKGLSVGTKISKEQLNGLCKGLEVIESRREKTSKEIDYI